jgi:hypothetical protein
MNLFLVIRNTEWSFTNSPDYIQVAIKKIIQLNGNDMNEAPKAVLLKAHQLAEQWGSPHP